MDKPIVFVFHGYPWLIHRLTYRRTNHKNLHVRGYKEEGTTTTPFDMCVLNDLDRFHLVMDVIERVPKLTDIGAHVLQAMRDKLIDHKQYILNTVKICLKFVSGAGTQINLYMNILVLNCGSSTVKFQLIATDLDLIEQNSDKRLARGRSSA